MKMSEKLFLVPELRVGYSRDLLGSGRTVVSELDSGQGAAFETRFGTPESGTFQFGTGVSARFADIWTWALYYSTEIGNDQEFYHNITSTLGIEF
jgi:hypothetical protein